MRNVSNQLSKILILLLFSTSACEKEDIPIVECSNPTRDITKAKQIIIGKWTWVSERYLDRIAQAYVIKTPQTEGYTRQFEFLKNNKVRIYQNQTLVETDTYEITTLDVVSGSDQDKGRTILLMRHESTGQSSDFPPLFICNDTLTLNFDAYSDAKGQEKWSKN